MIGTIEELNLKVKGCRLMTRAELQKFEEQMPEIDSAIQWWLADIDPDDDNSVAYAEGNDEGDYVYADRDRLNIYIRVALDIEGVANAGLKAGDEFIYCGYVFTVLDENIAISNNFVGCAKYYDEELAEWWYYDEEDEPPTNTVLGILECIFA